MAESSNLNVWYVTILVGQIWQDKSGKIGFVYDSDWVINGFPISHQLPLTLEDFPAEAGKAHQFFANLLPEADARTHIIRDLKISNSDFELLKAIGGECAGALSILPTTFQSNASQTYKKLTPEELRTLIQRKGQFSVFTFGEKRPRLSLAGAHDKCPIYFDGDHFSLPLQYSSSTHILKFSISDYRNIPVYEYFLTQLAHSIGLPVVSMELRKSNEAFFLLIERYDRIISNSKMISRLHQEDFCQALGIGYFRKYEQEGGPSFLDCYRLIDEMTINPIEDKENLLRWQIFNVLSGNSDGHAKNISILYNKAHQAILAPFYDLVCTRAVEGIDTKLALSVGGEFNPDKIRKSHWIKMANECNIRESYLIELILATSSAILLNLNKVQDEFEAAFGPYPALQRVHQVISKQCKKIVRELNAI